MKGKKRYAQRQWGGLSGQWAQMNKLKNMIDIRLKKARVLKEGENSQVDHNCESQT
jgi:hypothetical protein